MVCIAHRGFAGEHPENTVGALAAAADVADCIELDVRRCASGETVVVHDATVDRVTDGTGRVAELSRDELAGLNVLGSGEGIPTLREALDAIPASTGVNVELKERGLASDVATALEVRDNAALVSSFDDEALAEMAGTADCSLAYVVQETTESGIERALELGCTAVHPHWESCDEATIQRAHDADLVVNAWTIRDEDAAAAARAANVDGIITDYERFCDG